MQPITALFVSAVAKRRQNLGLAVIGGLIIGGSIVWPAYYFTSGKAAQRNQEKRLELPEKGKTTNKYGYACLYPAYITDTGKKYYFSPGTIITEDYSFQQFFCSEQQAQKAGYTHAQ